MRNDRGPHISNPVVQQLSILISCIQNCNGALRQSDFHQRIKRKFDHHSYSHVNVGDIQHATTSLPDKEESNHNESHEHHEGLSEAALHQLAEMAFRLQVDCRNAQKLLRALTGVKDSLTDKLMELERLLLLVDGKMHFERLNLVKLLHYVGGGVEIRELAIKELLQQISEKEMLRSNEEDLLSAQMLKTIEIVKLGDIKAELVNLDKQIILLSQKQEGLSKDEEKFLKEQRRRAERRKKGSPVKSPLRAQKI